MKILYLSKEFPPHTYGGAGVHLGHLCRELLRSQGGNVEIRVQCFGDQDEQRERFQTVGVGPCPDPGLRSSRHGMVLDTLYRNVVMAGFDDDVDIIHCHTWYSALAGCLLQRLLGRPLVLTSHSLEPHRPWKTEQLGTGYHVSHWLESTAYHSADGVIAVSQYMKTELESLYSVPSHKIRVIPNGIDLERYRPTYDQGVLGAYGIDPDTPFVLFVGRITRQKGIVHLLDAVPSMPPQVQVVLCAGSPDTPSIAQEVETRVRELQSLSRGPIVWISKTVPVDDLIVLYSHASVFVCPSIYEPFGIINLEAMACETPVVASAVGGIPEVVVEGHTGQLVAFQSKDPRAFAHGLGQAVHDLLSSPDRRKSMGREARRRVELHFSWRAIAQKTWNFYQELMSQDPVQA